MLKVMREEMTKERQSNFELLRIIAMVMIVFHHFSVHSDFFFESNVISFGDLELNTSVGEITCKTTGKSMKLGLKEFQLLEFLLKNKNQIVTKEQIIEKLWGLDSDSEYNNAEVYVSFTRKKIKFIGSNVVIRAVRGLGYTLEESK